MKHQFNLQDTVSVAGWLFADLLLGLSMIFLVSNTQSAPLTPTPTVTSAPTTAGTLVPWLTLTPTPTPAATLTPTPTPTPTPTLTPTPIPPPSLNRYPVSHLIRADPAALLTGNASAKSAEINRIQEQIRQLFGAYDGSSRAGIVLAFGTANTYSEGNDLARQVNRSLRDTLPGVFDDSTVFRDFHDLSGEYGSVQIEVYFLIGGQ